ncbi:MAG: potassium transporter TrkA, partial [Cyanobacteria bacterium J06555_3]
MPALISVLVAITLSLLITRIATEALTLTGLSRTSARFQARSAFTGTGFATSESEAIVKHPLRRRIIMWLMFLGN